MAGKDASGCFLNQQEPGRPAGQRADCLLPCVLDCARGFYFLIIRKKRIGPHLALIVAKRISRVSDEILQKGHCLIKEFLIIISQPEGRILRDDVTFNDPDSKVMGHNFQCQFKVMVNITACFCTDIQDTLPGKRACQQSLRKQRPERSFGISSLCSDDRGARGEIKLDFIPAFAVINRRVATDTMLSIPCLFGNVRVACRYDWGGLSLPVIRFLQFDNIIIEGRI